MDDGAEGAGDGEGAALGLGLQGYLGDEGAQDGHGVVDGLGVGLNRPGFTGGQNSRRIARYGTDIKEEDLEAIFA